MTLARTILALALFAAACSPGANAGAAEDWLVVVTSDHGGRGTNHTKGHDVSEILHSFLIVSGAAAARGTFAEPTYLVDAAATVLAHLGIDPDEAWGLDGVPRGLKPDR
jgi:arylsulfatase A-like enzyme